MKKFVSLLLALALLLSLAACGGSKAPDAAQGGAAATQEPAPAPTPEPTPEPAPEEDEPVMGVYDPETMAYVNRFLGLGVTLDEDWDVFDEEEIAALYGSVSELVTDEDAKAALEDTGIVRPFYAQAEDGLVTLSIVVENLGLLYGSLLDEDDYADISEDSILPGMESLGFTGLTLERVTLSFAGGQHTGFKLHGVLQDVDFYETLVCVKAGKNMAVITSGSYLTDVTGDVLDMFYGA